MNQSKTHFIITVDTEADSEWRRPPAGTTNNSRCLPRFQELCEVFQFKPSYLLTYEMAGDPFLVEYLREKQERGLCEIGAHLHPWSTPPWDLRLPEEDTSSPYAYEYPVSVQEAKLVCLFDRIQESFGVTPLSFKAGRWGLDASHASTLGALGVRVDTSVCPGINWSKSRGWKKGGPDFSNARLEPYYLSYDDILRASSHPTVLEVPQTILPIDRWSGQIKTVASISLRYPKTNKIAKALGSRFVWFRPYPWTSVETLKMVADYVIERCMPVLQLTFHSSELLPGGSPYFKDEASVELLFDRIRQIFVHVRNRGVKSSSLSDYYSAYTVAS